MRTSFHLTPPPPPRARRHELVPWSAAPRAALLPGGGDAHATALSRDAPLLVTRTFVLPTAVRDVAVTRSRAGVATPLLLFATAGGGVLALPKRLLDPRRPDREPTAPEKAEGLVRYDPVLPLHHAGMLLSYSRTVPRPRVLAAAPTAFESTSLVALLGAYGDGTGAIATRGRWVLTTV